MKNITIFFFIILNSISSYSQNSKKEIMNYYNELYAIDTDDINGKHLELAKQLTVDAFISYYLDNGKVIDTKKNGIQTITKLFSDSEFTYFGKTYMYGLLDFIKVTTIDLAKIDLDKLDGNKIRAKFIEQIVPISDKEKVKRKEKQCSSLYSNPQFTYQYQKINNDILITYKWKISCDFLYKIINKTYTAKFSLTDYTLTK